MTPGKRDYDSDDDGLIEVTHLEQLATLHYDLDGDGKPDNTSNGEKYAAAFPAATTGMGCPDTGCTGYELTSDLDFDDSASYASGSVDRGWSKREARRGWLPLGMVSDAVILSFEAEFEGNGHTITNLFIDQPEAQAVGMFSVLGPDGAIRQVALSAADVEGEGGVGILVGRNDGTIMNSQATGRASGVWSVGGLAGINYGGEIRASHANVNVSADSASAGGLVGDHRFGHIRTSHASGGVSGERNVGGLVGQNYIGDIIRSYATGSVSGKRSVGGLVGENGGGSVGASYATGKVSGETTIGGLVGENQVGLLLAVYATGSVSGRIAVGGLVGKNGGNIKASYATGVVSGNAQVGGLIGSNANRLRFSYWDTETSGQLAGAGNTDFYDSQGMTTVGLQAPTGYAGIYKDWDIDIDNADRDEDESTGADDPWDFGTDKQYPALRADIDGDGTANWQEFGDQRVSQSARTLSATPEPTAQVAPGPTTAPTPEPAATSTPRPTPTPSLTATPTPEPAATSTPRPTPTPSLTATPTPEPAATSTLRPTPIPSLTATSTLRPTPTPEPTVTMTPPFPKEGEFPVWMIIVFAAATAAVVGAVASVVLRKR